MTSTKHFIIEKKKLADFLDGLRKKCRVVAPVKNAGLILFEEVASGQDALLDFANSKKSPKELFFPQSDVLFSYETSGREIELKEPVPGPKTAIFGVRPCDTRGILMLDRVFLQTGREDPNYQKRRENTTILALGCASPRSTCFCTSMGGGPFAVEGADALFTDIGDSYLVEVLTPKGLGLFGQNSLFVEADQESFKLAEEVKKKAHASIETKVEAKRASELKLLDVFKSGFWDMVHEKCLGCGICTYLCPTCSCFDVVDEKNSTGGERIRIWDPCLFPLYTLQASGFNPRPTGKERMRQRILHKLNYASEGRGDLTCVGCGRCVSNCPVNLDIRQVINSLAGGIV